MDFRFLYQLHPVFAIAIFTIIIGYTYQFCAWIIGHLILRGLLKNVPGPKTYPFIGIAFQLLPLKHEDFFYWFRDLTYQYKNGLVLTWLGTDPIIHIRRPHHMEIVLTHTKNIRKSSIYDTIKPWLGDGLLTATGSLWTKHRKLLTPTFHFTILESFAGIMSDKAEIFCECIQSTLTDDPDRPMNIFPMALRCTLDTFCETAIGLCEDLQRKPASDYFSAIKRLQVLSIMRTTRPWLFSDWMFWLTRDGREYFQCIKTLHNFTMKVIERKVEERKLMDESGKTYEPLDALGRRKKKAFLDYLLDICEGEPRRIRLKPKQIREEVDTFMFAGHDTTAVAISWCLFALGNNPEIQDKVHKELRQVFGQDESPATLNQLNQLKYLDQVMKETMRYYPSVPNIGRHIEHDMIIDDYLIPKGTSVFIQMMHMYHDPEVWEDPEKFDPDRFTPENIEKRHPFAYVPFSAGPRNCIGQKFAKLEFKTVLTSVLRKYRIKSARKQSEMKVVAGFVLMPENDTVDLYFERL